MLPLLAQAEPEAGVEFGGVLLGVLILGLLAFAGARIIASRRGGGPKRGA